MRRRREFGGGSLLRLRLRLVEKIKRGARVEARIEKIQIRQGIGDRREAEERVQIEPSNRRRGRTGEEFPRRSARRRSSPRRLRWENLAPERPRRPASRRPARQGRRQKRGLQMRGREYRREPHLRWAARHPAKRHSRPGMALKNSLAMRSIVAGLAVNDSTAAATALSTLAVGSDCRARIRRCARRKRWIALAHLYS